LEVRGTTGSPKRAFKIRWKGYGWEDWSTPFSSSKDPSVGSVTALREHIEAKMKEEKVRRPRRDKPPHPPEPGVGCRLLGELGASTAQALRLRVRSRWSRSELRAKARSIADEKAAQRGAAKKRKNFETADPDALGQPDVAPMLDEELVGRHIEVLTWVEDGTEGEGDEEKMKWAKMWWPAVVVALSDGSEAYKKGWFKLEYDDGYIEWSKLRTFNCRSVGSWRLNLDYEGAREDEDGEAGKEAADSGSESGDSDDIEDEESDDMEEDV